MLRHIGQRRSFRHNLRLAVLLCINAGFINAAGYFAFQVLTTNVTGHAAQLAVNAANANYDLAKVNAIWLFLFLLGAFSSGLVISKVGRDRPAAYTLPIVLIIAITCFVAVYGAQLHTHYLAGALLYGMGMQNAMVSMISGSVVRTTHLTGMFTDLGIDLSQALTQPMNKALRGRLVLRSSIIFTFLTGGILGGLAYHRWGFDSFYIPSGIMIVALFYDYFRVRIKKAVRKS